MYEELVKELRKESCGAKTTTWWRAADAIEELSAAVSGYEATTDVEFVKEDGHECIRFVPKWISVNERLPEAWEEVMLQFPNNQAAGFFDGDCGWGVFSGDDFYTYVAPEETHPTHWAKKLPEPPKEETE